MILKYYNNIGEVAVIEITNKDIQKFADDYFDAAERHNKHADRQATEEMKPAAIAVYNSLTEGFWKYNGPLNALASIHSARKEAEKKSTKNGK